MQCEEFEVQLNEALDRRLPLAAVEALAHQRVCAACRERAAAYAAIAHELARAPLPSACADLAERVVAELRQPAVVPLARSRPPWVLAAAAALVMAVVGGWALKRGGFFDHANRRQVAGRSADSTSRRAPSTRKKIAHARRQQAPAAEPTQPPQPSENSIASVLPGAEDLPGAEWAQQVAEGFQPVTRPTLGAATGFLQVWGVSQKRPPSAKGPRS